MVPKLFGMFYLDRGKSKGELSLLPETFRNPLTSSAGSAISH